MGERELDGALVALREPTRDDASAPLEPVLRAARARRRRARITQAAMIVVVVIIGGGLARWATGRNALVETRAPERVFGAPAMSPEEADRYATVLRTRFALLGLGGSEVTVKDGGVEVRSSDDVGRVQAAMTPGIVEFRSVLAVVPRDTVTTVAGTWLTGPDPAAVLRVKGDAAADPAYELGPSELDASAIVSAVERAELAGRWTVVVRLRRDGIEKLSDLASRCHNAAASCPEGQFVVVVAGRVVAALTADDMWRNVRLPLLDLGGNYTEESAKRLAGLLELEELPR